ncbi:tRNA (guanosine(46)-N7)-methyltransferase TrmB [Jongsikchunia kroppenstedtii]|uniref:tRNA (guanosine(46)-N7)-methyltransferase TrmB n=1 Tax=Jongsikchunia kroppenstedtii TaxID=1121721 RepID=UPI000382C3FC
MRDDGGVSDTSIEAQPPSPEQADDARGGERELTPEERARLFPRVTSYRFRRGAMTPNQLENWDRLWPQIGHDADENELDLPAWFGRSAPTVVEIGCGTGTSTAAMAADEPDLDVIAVEVYKPGLAKLIGLIDRGGITNIRMIRGDAIVALRHMIPEASLIGARVFFPDPWPKARHHKRRLLQGGTFGLLARVIIDDGVLHIATDHADYAEWIQDELANQEYFEPFNGETPFSLDRPVTKFEGRAHTEGREITEFVLQRKARS